MNSILGQTLDGLVLVMGGTILIRKLEEWV
jgi:hypothetical protein